MARHAPRCAQCGAPTRPQRSGGVASLVCVACGATTVDPRGAREERPGDPTAPPVRPGVPERSKGLPDDLTLDEPVLSLEGLAALGEAGFESELEHLRSQRRKQLGMLMLMGLSGAAFVVFVPLVVLGVGAIRVMWEAPASAPVPSMPSVVEVAEPEVAPEDAAPEPPEDEVIPGEDEAEPVVEPEAPSAPDEPEPAPEPVDPVQALMKQGWAVASRAPAEGAEAFRKALELSPRHAEASYGLGYCLLKQGDLAGAQQHLCVARTSSKADIRRDVEALLANNGLTCSP